MVKQQVDSINLDRGSETAPKGGMGLKLYRFGYVGMMKIEEIEAEGETKCYWIINGRKDIKVPGSYPDSTWYRTAEEAVRSFIDRSAKSRDIHLKRAQEYQEKIDKAGDILIRGLK